MTRRKRLRITGTLYLAGGLCPLTRLCLETMRRAVPADNARLRVGS